MDGKLSREEIQRIEFEILKLFASFCEDNALRYYLSGGTLLGAVRHGGFIPWDDDIDVIMPRPDYNRFVELFQKAIDERRLPRENLRLSVNEIDTVTRVMDTRTVARMHAFDQRNDIGLWIDIFPMDGMPDNRFVRRFHYIKIRLLRDCLFFLTTKRNIRRRSRAASVLQYVAVPFRPILRRIGVARFATIINRTASKYDFDTSRLVAAISAGYGLQEVNVREDYIVPMRIKFRDAEFQTTAAYHTYLTQLYGDYMQPPPENKRNKHGLEAWWKTNGAPR